MKNKIILFLFFIFSIPFIFSQNTQNKTIKINWKGIEKWTADSSFIHVIAFQDAKYPDEKMLPHYIQRIDFDSKFNYQVEIKNPVYIPVTAEEAELLGDKNSYFATAQLSTIIQQASTNKFLEINILPFATINGNLMKLNTFELQISTSANPKKVSSSTFHTYSSSSVLAQGKFVKIHVINSGVYKLTYEDLVNMGVDPSNVRIFGYGGAVLDQNFLSTKIDDLPECAIWMEKGSDGIFNAGDYILFYAQGVNAWNYDKTLLMFTHSVNYYSKYAYYFVTSDAGTGKKIQDITPIVPADVTINPIEEFTDYQLHEKDLINLCKSGKEFYGEPFDNILSYNFPLTFQNAVVSAPVYTRLDVAAAAVGTSTFSLSLNSGQTKTLSLSKIAGDNYEQAKGATGLFTFNSTGDSFNFTVAYTKYNPTSIGYLNYLEVNARRQLTMNGSVMQFQNVDYLGMNSYNQYLLSSANSNVKIWDITDPENINNMVTTNIGGKLSFTASGYNVANYLAIDTKDASAFSKPEIDGQIQNQNLHALDPVNMVIIVNPLFLAQAQTLAQAHREKDNLSVAVVTTDQVYNEFSSGTPDATAYRWFMKMLYDRANSTNNTTDMPKYLLLFGRGTFDNRKLLQNSGDNLILTYQAENSLNITLSYVTDDYFGLLNDNEGTQVPSNLIDIGIGRFPVTTVQQATDLVNKTIGYMNNQNKGNWKNQLCFLADDGDASLHARQADSVASTVSKLYPAYQVNKIYLDAFQQVVNASGQSYPLAKSKFMNLLRSGIFLLDYTGHASPSGWANENILTTNDVKNLSNQNLPIVVGATCDFLQYDEEVVSGGEQVVLNPLGGGIGILSSARPVYASQNLNLNLYFNQNLFKRINGENLRVGDALEFAKNTIGSEINKLCYVYMGDPAVKLTFPTKYQILTTKINQSTSFGNDTLRAMSVANIQGKVADYNGNTITGFNGVVHATIYDKIQRITTLNNEGDGALTYSDRPNTLFSGDAAVTNGMFNISFMLPKDIKYNFGTGRINYYAQESTDGSEAQGYFENFVVGGTYSDNLVDTIGPDVKLYLNSTNFVTGDKVNETPLLIANVNDEHGINTVGSGIGHDIMLTIDNDPAQSYILNDYFQADANSYTTGTLNFKLPEMVNGKHTLTFRVWDLLNNSTVSSIDFEVVKGLTPQIFSIYNYPNPVKTSTKIIVNHDRPETILSTTVEIFDLAGRKIWSFSQSSADNISWNLIANDGSKVQPGIYLYRVSIKTSDSNITSKTNKMLITTQ
jgi:hypothetical protein